MDDARSPGYEISGGADRALFAIDETHGVLTFQAAPNYEDPQDAGHRQRLCGGGAGDQRHG